jgi:hypothetical protein
MTKTKNFEQLRSKLRADPESRILGEQYERAIRDALALGKLRESHGGVQEEVADIPANSQNNAARVELRDNPYLSALSGYIAELSGRLEITAVFPGQRISLVLPSGEQTESGEESERKVSVSG